MRDYTITFARSARKELEALDRFIINRIFPRIEALSRNPRPRGSRKLQGKHGLYRLRIGDYRAIYTVNDDSLNVDIVAIRHRSRAYE